MGFSCSTETDHPERSKAPSVEVCRARCVWEEPWLSSSSAGDSPALSRKLDKPPLAASLGTFPCFCVKR